MHHGCSLFEDILMPILFPGISMLRQAKSLYFYIDEVFLVAWIRDRIFLLPTLRVSKGCGSPLDRFVEVPTPGAGGAGCHFHIISPGHFPPGD